MLNLLWLIPALPLAGYVILALAGARMPRGAVSAIGVGSVGLSAGLALAVAVQFLSAPPPGSLYVQTLWTWMRAEGFAPAIALQLDALSLLMALVVTVVGFLIHLYSTEYMAGDEAYSRFFAYMNLFVSSMLILVLADNLLLLYLGWEGVGLCSYLLIGFWYRDPANGYAARKAFVVTRVGDTAMGIGLFLLATQLGTLTIRDILGAAAQQWAPGSGMAVAVSALLLGGAVGKSGQLPLQVWLPDAMAGPTPVSALIHAATMVTAGVYLIARMHVVFTLAPVVMHIVAAIGAITLLLAGFSALAQTDIKRVLAYSTISQIGYMFLALGVGAFGAAMFHFFTHAFFKALLFLGAGAVILAMHHEQDMFRMGGLRQRLPVVFWTFLVGSASLAAVPLVTAGFYSKDLILWDAWSRPLGSPVLWAAGLLGAFITGVYTFRMVFIVFFGPPRVAGHPHEKERAHDAGAGAPEGMAHGEHTPWRPGPRTLVPLLVLAVGAAGAGFIELPHTMGHLTLFSDFIGPVLPAGEQEARTEGELLFQVIAAVVSLGGIALAYLLYLRDPLLSARLARTPAGSAVRRFLRSGWGFDWLYDRLFVRPVVWFARVNRSDAVDLVYTGLAALVAGFFYLFRPTQSGKVRAYAAGIAVGAIVMIVLVVFL